MKTLVLKSLLAISLIAVTSAALALPPKAVGCNEKEWNTDVICGATDKDLSRGANPAQPEGASLDAKYPGGCRECWEAKNAVQGRLLNVDSTVGTAAKPVSPGQNNGPTSGRQ